MIVGLGNDIIEIDRIQKAINNGRFLEKYFTEKENKLFAERKNKVECIAGNFAVKEAVSKVLGTGFRKFGLTDIEVLRDDLGKPYIILHNNAKDIADSLKINNFFVTISHCKKYVNAVAIGESDK